MKDMKKRRVEVNGVSITYLTGWTDVAFEKVGEFFEGRTSWKIEGKEYAGFLEFSDEKNPLDSPVVFYLFIKGKRTGVVKLEIPSAERLLKVERSSSLKMDFGRFRTELANLLSGNKEFEVHDGDALWKAVRRDLVDETEFRFEYKR